MENNENKKKYNSKKLLVVLIIVLVIILVIAIPILFVIGTTYNAIKEQKKLEDGILKIVLKKREEMKKINLKKQQK